MFKLDLPDSSEDGAKMLTSSNSDLAFAAASGPGEEVNTAVAEQPAPLRSICVVTENASTSIPTVSLGGRSVKTDIFSMFRQRSKVAYISALTDVSVKIYEGDRVAILGTNGAGKTTLLKTIAGLYPLESGRVVAMGKVRGLFEIGLGVDFEETGRANIYNRGFAMGLSKEEIAEREEDIENVAGLGEFIDLPMKSYSSGMTVRLMFAIATAFPCEILLLDEFISAGDALFMQKVNDRVKNLFDTARCVMIATHSVDGALAWCNRAIWMRNGRVAADGPVEDVVAQYREFIAQSS